MDDEPNYDISIVHHDGDATNSIRIQEAVAATLRRHNILAASVAISMVDDAQIQELNRRHLDCDRPTDVLAFDLGDADSAQSTGETRIEGDVIISTETAEREARRRGHESLAELCLYAVHGTLHLLGYDDHEQADANKMHELEDDLLAELGFGKVYGVEANEN